MHVLVCRAMVLGNCGELEPALEAAEKALSLIPREALADRAALIAHLLVANYNGGRFANVARSITELEVVARRAGRHDLVAWSGAAQSAYQLNLTGDLRAYLERMEILRHIEWLPATRLRMAAARLHLGDTEHALAQLASVVTEPIPSAFKGVAKAIVFGGTALVGGVEDARTLFGDVEPWLPAVDKRNPGNAWAVLDVSVPGLVLAGDVVRCGALYPSCTSYLGTGMMINYWSIVPGNPQTVAGIAAHAAGLNGRARDHFETAIRQADTLPHRLLQPTARYWYGRLLVDDPHSAEQARGRALIEAAVTDFRSLEMVTYANLAEQFLRQ
jgi:MalT-like TPR region